MTAPRALIAIPHYVAPPDAGDVGHGAQQPKRRRERLLGLRECLIGLHSLFGGNRFGCRHQSVDLIPVDNPARLDLDIRLIVKPGCHLLDTLDLPTDWYAIEERNIDPIELGFEARDLLADSGRSYDWFVYLEDDLIIEDPLFFLKLAAFNSVFAAHGGTAPLLQPVRFERPAEANLAPAYVCARLYPEFSMAEVSPWAGWAPTVDIPFLERNWRMTPTTSPHSGCFFLNRAQLDHLAEKPIFRDRTRIAMTALDTAASLAISQTFAIYKPASGHESFLEIRHFGPRAIDELHEAGPDALPRWDHPAYRQRPPSGE